MTGRLYIPEDGICVAVFDTSGMNGNQRQHVVDLPDSAAMFYLGGQCVIGDHDLQGFQNIRKSAPGKTKAYFQNGLYTDVYLCIETGSGINTGTTILDQNGISVEERNDEDILLYTCNGNWQNISYTVWKKLSMQEEIWKEKGSADSSVCYRLSDFVSDASAQRLGRGGGVELQDNYVSTDQLTEDDKQNPYQKNGNAITGDDGSSFAKTAEWINKLSGEAKISLVYQAPPFSEDNTAVFVFGTCNAHGFSADIAKAQIQELLDHYDRVDCITTYQHAGDMYGDGYLSVSRETLIHNSRKVSASFYASDGDANNAKIEEFLNPSSSGDACFISGAHWTGSLCLRYLQDYLQGNTPTAIYISFDGNRAFQNGNTTADDGVQNTAYALYGQFCNALDTSGSYDMFGISNETMQKLGEYQKQGRYYVCISNATYSPSDSPSFAGNYPFARLNICNYFSTQKHSVLLAYYSVAAFAPYYFANHNQELRNYFDTAQVHDYSWFTEDLPDTAPVINYGQTFGSQGTVFAQKTLTITDTLSDGLEFSKNNIYVSVTDADGNLLDPQPDTDITADGQDVTIAVQGIKSENRVICEIFCSSSGSFATAEDDFQETNNGDAKACLTGNETSPLVLPSPRLYSQPVSLPNTGGNGRRRNYSAAAVLTGALAILCCRKRKRGNSE